MDHSSTQNLKADNNLEKWILVGILFVAITIATILGYAIKQSKKAVEHQDWVNYSHAVIGVIWDLKSNLFLAHQYRSLWMEEQSTDTKEAYQAELSELDANADLLRSHLELDKDLQVAVPDTLKKLESIKAPWTETDTLDLESVTNQSHFKDLSILPLLEQIERYQLEQIQERHRATLKAAKVSRGILLAGIALNWLLLAGVYFLARREINSRKKIAELLSADKVLLEKRVDERTVELSQAVQSLKIEVLKAQWSQLSTERTQGFYKGIFENLREGLCVVSRQGRILNANGAVESVLKWKIKDLAGRNIMELFSSDTEKSSWENSEFALALEKNSPLRALDCRTRSQGGEEIPLQVSCYPVIEKGRCVGGILLFTRQSQV